MTLDAGLQLGQTATDLLSITYSRSGLPHFFLEKAAVEEHIVSLYKRLTGNDINSTLNSVQVRLETNRQYNEWIFVVQAQSRDGKSFRVEKDFSEANPGSMFHDVPALAYADGDPFG